MLKRQHYAIGFILILLFTITFYSLSFQGYIGNNPDGRAHWVMVNEPEIEPTYAPLLRTVGAIFGVKEDYWNFYIVFLFAFITPLILLFATKKWYVVWFYFSTTSYFYYFIQGAYSQALAINFAIAILFTKNNYLRVILLIIGITSHSRAPFLLPVLFALVLVNENKEWLWKEVKKYLVFAPFCSVFTQGNSSVEKLTGSSIADVPINSIGVKGEAINYIWNGITFTNIFSLFVKITPLPFLYACIRSFWVKKEYHLILIFILTLLFSLSDGARAWYLFAPIMVYGLTNWVAKSKHKRFWFILSIIWFVFQIEQFYSFSKLC